MKKINKNKLRLGVDCGGTNLKLAVVKESGEIVRSRLEPIDFREPSAKVIDKIAKSIKNFLNQAKIKKVSSIGMGVAGDVDQANGIIRFSPNLNWRNVALKEALIQKLKTPVFIDNDANCAAWGAYCLDAKKDCDHLVCLTLGTGVGGGIVLNKKLYRGATGSAGEIGHMTVEIHGRACRCGNFGCLESMIGSWGLIQTAEEGLRKGLAPLLEKILHGSPKKELNPETIATAARKGDAYCQQLWKDAGEYLGAALSNLVNVFNPERIVLCGGVSKVGALLLDPTMHSLGRRAFATPAQKVKVTISQFDERLGVVGAALLLGE